MAWANWPANVPQRFLIGSTSSSRQNRVEFKPKYGPPMSRPGTTDAEIEFKVTCIWTLEQAQAFEEWWHTTLGDGNLPFNGIHPIYRTPGVYRIPDYTMQEDQTIIRASLTYIKTFG